MKLFKEIVKACRRLTRPFKHRMPIVGIIFTLFSVIFVGGKFLASRGSDVYAAPGQQEEVKREKSTVPPGIAGAISGVIETQRPADVVKRIGTSCEEVIVGQRKRKVEAISTMDASNALQETVYNLTEYSDSRSATATIMSDRDYNTLLSIVEAESGGEDLKGRIMVANVILNRVSDERFPDNVYDVVWEVVGGTVQFSPTEDGRIATVDVSDKTLEAVKLALVGADYSEGALFFVAKDQADKDNVKWFEKDLALLLEYGVHSFYTYPEDK